MGCRGKQYDGALNQCIEEVKEPDPKHLAFLKWLYDRGHFAGEVYSDTEA